MLSYQHGYHAGNFADVLKHAILSQIIHYLTQKEKPLLYLETHAGKGVYDLQDKQAIKTGEAKEGIELLWRARKQLPDIFAHYIASIEKINANETLRYYPGSPLLAIHTLRKKDRLVCCELHPGEYQQLIHIARRDNQVTFIDEDGLSQLSAQLPPKERRGLIFMDPSYEVKTDYRHIPIQINAAVQRFSTGVYCLWYPLVDNKLHHQLIRGLEQIGTEKKLQIEFYLNERVQAGMRGCGLWVINPPYQLATQAKKILTTLGQYFNPGLSSYLIKT
ncbi:MAG: 23S rRNA (adenine(2030)-N(6))-methyltransferase RlmJ [Legionella sp.]